MTHSSLSGLVEEYDDDGYSWGRAEQQRDMELREQEVVEILKESLKRPVTEEEVRTLASFFGLNQRDII